MERTEEALRKRVRETPLSERLTTCEKYIASMCAERRPPKMTIPLQHYDEDFYIYTTLADAQATIAALQARVQELEAIKIPDDAFTYCAYCGEKSPVDEHNEDLSAHIKVCPKHPIRDVEAQLTQRTAELEAANKLLYKKNCALGRAETIINDLQAELERVRGELAKMRERKDGAYLERNCVVAALATCFPSGVARTAIEGWDEEWHGCVYIDLPVGQVSWHYHDSHAHLFAHLPAYTKPWDGHTTEEKYERVAMLQHRQGMEGQHGSR